MITWDKATLPHLKGRMGILSINQLDIINKIKATWRCLNHKSLFGLWCWHKYCSLWSNFNHRYSPQWRRLRFCAQHIKDNLLLKVGLNSTFSFYFDSWCHGKSILEFYINQCFTYLNLLSSSRLNCIMDKKCLEEIQFFYGLLLC